MSHPLGLVAVGRLWPSDDDDHDDDEDDVEHGDDSLPFLAILHFGG